MMVDSKEKKHKKDNGLTANITHELKTPLTSIIGFIELLKKSGEKDKDTREYFYDIIDSEAQRLLQLIDDVLLMSQVENYEASGLIHECDIKKEVTTVLRSIVPLAMKKNIQIHELLDDNLKINASSTHIQQLFSNLISNAIKYNVVNGEIFIKAYREDSSVVISIKDTGIGINSKYIDKVFDRFYRVNAESNGDIPGNGLGLSIVKDIVTLYNGNIKLRSQPGKGSEFIVSFPVMDKIST